MCPEDPIRPERPEGSSEFHETDFYSLFQEQNGTLSEGKRSTDGPSDEIDERTIQELMDAALQKGGAPSPPSSDTLDTSAREDWAGAVEDHPGPRKESHQKPVARPVRKPTRPLPKRPASPEAGTRRGKKVSLTRLWGQTLKVAGIAILLGTVALGVYIWGILPRSGGLATVARAAELHAAGSYAPAAELYEELEFHTDAASGPRSKIAFLRGGVYEQMWRGGQDPGINFDRSLAAYDEAVRLDGTELRVYAVEAMLAKAEMLVEEAHRSETVDAKLQREGWSVLAGLIDDPNYRVNPAVYQGVPHRRLAEWMRGEDPEAAIELLKKARDAQGDLEEGLENLSIALIYRDLLNNPEKAEEYFDLVEQNELASGENHRQAEEALDELREGETRPDDFFSYDSHEVETDLESNPPETMEP